MTQTLAMLDHVPLVGEFLGGWPLFWQVYTSGWLIATVLAVVGVVVVARDQIFIGAAVAQASTLGIAAAMLAGIDDGWAPAFAVGFAVLASLLTARRSGMKSASHESITGWVFLASSALAVLLVTKSPHGLEEVQRLMASSLIGATTTEVWVFGVFAAVTAALVWAMHRPILMLVMDADTAAAIGMNVALWGYGIAAYLGLALGLSLRSGGMLYAFGCLILPALVARNLCREVRPMFVVAPLVALVTAMLAFVVANHFDWPPAQATVALQAAALLPAWAYRTWKGGVARS